LIVRNAARHDALFPSSSCERVSQCHQRGAACGWLPLHPQETHKLSSLVHGCGSCHLISLSRFVSGLSLASGVGEISRAGMAASCLFHDFDFAHASGSYPGSPCDHHSAPSARRKIRPASAHRSLDAPPLVLCLGHRRRCLPHALPPLLNDDCDFLTTIIEAGRHRPCDTSAHGRPSTLPVFVIGHWSLTVFPRSPFVFARREHIIIVSSVKTTCRK